MRVLLSDPPHRKAAFRPRITPLGRVIRIPEKLRRELARMAKQHGMSLNAEILQRLQTSIDADLYSELEEIKCELKRLDWKARQRCRYGHRCATAALLGFGK
jgi:hypothetical protein